MLLRGLDGTDLFMPMFLTPFTAVMLGIWAAVWSAMRSGGLLPRNVHLLARGGRIIARIVTVSPLVAGIVALAAAAFAGIFVIGFTLGMEAPLAVMAAVWGILICVGLTGALVQRRRLERGDYDLIIDRARRLLIPPKKARLQSMPEIAISAIGDIHACEREERDSEGKQPHMVHDVVMTWRDAAGALREQTIAQWFSAIEAESFTRWLRQQVGLPAVDAPTRQAAPRAGRAGSLE